ncbi:MAG: hypothetical protein HY741_13390 [Chloroflexi bacterium]|nr:hypothetical protein [Chloroflexota bacterium]
MTRTITLELSAEMLQRYRRGAVAARKGLEDFVVERLAETAPPHLDDLPSPLRQELHAMERQSSKALLRIAQSRLPTAQQRVYSRLLRKNSQGLLTLAEQVRLRTLGEQARTLTLKKAHAAMLLKWRGDPVSPPDSFPTR